MKLPALYKTACEHPGDINEHLPTLREIGSWCEHITEIGARYSISTIAFLMANPKYLVSWDIDPSAIYLAIEHFMKPPGLCGRTLLQPRVGNSREFLIEPTDLLFIDTYHTYEQLAVELERHGDKARKFIALHDTSRDAFGETGQDGKKPGLRQAVREFQEKRGFAWTCVRDDQNNNGLIVLERRPFAASGAMPLMMFGQEYPRNPERTD